MPAYRHTAISLQSGAGAHQVVQDGDGEIKHAHLDRLSERSVQAEQRPGFHAARSTQPRLRAANTHCWGNGDDHEKKKGVPRAGCYITEPLIKKN